jgi:hypothetical protein
VCLNILREDWKPVLNLNSVMVGLQYLFLEPNPDDPLNKGELTAFSTTATLNTCCRGCLGDDQEQRAIPVKCQTVDARTKHQGRPVCQCPFSMIICRWTLPLPSLAYPCMFLQAASRRTIDLAVNLHLLVCVGYIVHTTLNDILLQLPLYVVKANGLISNGM